MHLRMQIRWKLLIALLAIGIAPLLFSGWLDARRLSALGTRLAEQSGQALSDQTRANLEQLAGHYARVVERERQFIELALRIQSREAGIALRGPVPHPVPPLYWSDAFDREDPALALVTEPAKYRKRSADGGVVPLPVSLAHQVFFNPASIARAELAADAARLTSLTSLYEEFTAEHDDVVHRQFIALSSGLLASYPGHGGFPAEYDPRNRTWYRQHDGNSGVRWAAPHIDAVAGRAITNVTAPLRNAEGELIGVAGIDVALVELLRKLSLGATNDGASEALLTFLVEDADGGEAEIRIAARAAGESQTGDWRESDVAARLELPGAVGSRLRANMREREAGLFRTSYAGRDSFLIYQPFGESTGDLVFILPAGTLVDPAIRAARYALESTQRQIDRALPLAAAIIGAVVLLAFVGSKTITAPIHRLADAVNRVGEGDFDTRVSIGSGDELEELGEAFNAMVPQLREHTRVREALGLAAEVQRRLLPAAAPVINGLDVAGFSRYSEQTGGDYYDFIQPSSRTRRRIGIALGDVSGHGIASALLMATVRALLRGMADTEHSPAELVNHINRKIAEGVVAGQFMTLCYFDIDLDGATARWCNAGHDPAIRFNRVTNTFSELAGGDIPLGVDGKWIYRGHGIDDLTTDDIIVLGTDGIWETRNPRGEFFGKARLRDIIRNHQHATAAGLCETIVADLERFRGTAPRRDDVTAVVFRLQAPALRP